MVFETPAKYVVDQPSVTDARDFFSPLNLKGLRLVREYRAPIIQTVIDLMQDFGIIQCVDLSRQNPSYNLDVTYSRLFGKGQHNIYQFNDIELTEIDKNRPPQGNEGNFVSWRCSILFSLISHVQKPKSRDDHSRYCSSRQNVGEQNLIVYSLWLWVIYGD